MGNKYLISIKLLKEKGIDFNKKFYELPHNLLAEIKIRCQKDHYTYLGPCGHTILYNYYQKLKRIENKI